MTGFQFLAEVGIFSSLLLHTSWVLGPPIPPVYWVLGAVCPGGGLGYYAGGLHELCHRCVIWKSLSKYKCLHGVVLKLRDTFIFACIVFVEGKGQF